MDEVACEVYPTVWLRPYVYMYIIIGIFRLVHDQ